jgi:uncharacterized protein (DUF1330 family)
MPAYIIVNIEVTNPVPYERYKAMAEATVTAYGGKYIVRGGPAERLEGGWEPKRVVVLEFPDAARARAWWVSEDYRPAKELRQACAKSEMIVVTGIGD